MTYILFSHVILTRLSLTGLTANTCISASLTDTSHKRTRMEKLPYHPLAIVTKEDIQNTRLLYGVNDSKKLKESLDAVQEWCQKQDHLKDSCKYLNHTVLERLFLISKGSIEVTKQKLDKLLTSRGMMPELLLNRKNEEFEGLLNCVNYIPLPKLCRSDQSRVMITQFLTDKLDEFTLLGYFRYGFMIGEYRTNYDNTVAERYIIDMEKVNINILSKLNPIVIKKAEILCTEVIGVKIKGIHILNAPAFVDKVVFVMKQALKEKIANRILVHSTYEELHQHIPKEILPKDYGGDEEWCSELAKQWQHVLQGEEAKKIIKEFECLVSDETYRHSSKFNEEYMGARPGAAMREYDLDKPGLVDQAVDGLEEWMKKQNHFIKKDFSREYLERKIIFCKGSVERAKKKLDRNCTLKTLMPSFYETINLKTDYKDSSILLDAVLPKLTEDHYRIYLLRNIGQRFVNGMTNYFRFIILIAEYIIAHDYMKGMIIILDYTHTNLFELIKKLDVVELRQAITMLIEGYGMRIKGIHIITPSKAVETVVAIFKQVLTAKLGERIQIHSNYESLHKVVSKDVLPVEYGGNERSIAELHEQWVNILSSNEFQEYFREMRGAATNEKYRQADKLNDEYMGIAGTFRTLSFD
ncbi:unnamed protein product, partial [Iphiclides podalirius]